MGWTMLYLFVFLKLPILAAVWIVWWAVHQEPDPAEGADGGGGDRAHPHPRPKRPKPPRRDPHGNPELPSPPRVRSVVSARADEQHPAAS